ncbi:MFS transporter [Streptomyces sp. NPDC057136]|uniref:MFS transporter n=1 Tax=Streptomyces sp. NPDC057136 TaxID=3346029 RepID=UPI0036312AC5
MNRLRGHPWLTLAPLALGGMMVSLDTTVVAVAQPAMQADLGASVGDIQWVTTGYLLSLAAMLVVAGKLGDRLGHRRVFLVGTAGFAATSVAIGLSTDITWITALRVVQGVFGALMQPPTLALLRATFPADRLNVPIAVRSGALGIATAAGPVIGGLLVQYSRWESIFFINLPLGVVAIAMGLLVLREARLDSAAKSSDPVAVILLSGTLLALLWGSVQAPEYGWGDTRIWGALAGACVLGAGFCMWEARAPEPLVPLSLFRSPAFSAGVMLMVLVSFIMFGVPFVCTFFLQNVLGLSPVQCGVLVLWLTLAMVVAGIGTGLLMRRTGSRAPALLGMALTAVAAAGLAHATGAGSSLGELRLWFVVLGLGFSAVIVASTHLIVAAAPLRHSGVAGGLQQTAMQVGGSLGTAVLGAVLVARVDGLLPQRLAGTGTQLSGRELDEAVRSVSLGIAPQSFGPEAASVVPGTFIDGMDATLLISGLVAALAALAGWLLLRRSAAEAEAPDEEAEEEAESEVKTTV